MHPSITPKVTGAATAAAVATIIVWIIEASYKINLEPPIEGAIATIAAFLGGLFVSDKTRAWLGRKDEEPPAPEEEPLP